MAGVLSAEEALRRIRARSLQVYYFVLPGCSGPAVRLAGVCNVTENVDLSLAGS